MMCGFPEAKDVQCSGPWLSISNRQEISEGGSGEISEGDMGILSKSGFKMWQMIV